jgi:C1A family cysteine protease
MMQSLNIESLFMQHIADFGLSYGTVEEFNFRMDLFSETNDEIQ